MYHLSEEMAQQLDDLAEEKRREEIQRLFTEQKNNDGESILDCLGGRSVTKEEKKKLQGALQSHLKSLFQ